MLRGVEVMLTSKLQWTAAERHLRDGEIHLSQLEAVVAGLMWTDRVKARLLVACVLVPFRHGVMEMRERLVALRAERATLSASK